MIELVCITKDEYYLGTLTTGKIYKGSIEDKVVYSSDGVYYKITNDVGILGDYHQSLFISLSDYREMKIKLILPA